MKEKWLESLKKTAVMLIAAVMVLGLVPVGLMVRPTTVRAEGEFLRILPEAETCVGEPGANKENSVFHHNDGTLLTGGSYDAYLRFDIRHLLNKKTEDIHSAALRLVLLRTPAGKGTPLRVYWMSQDEEFPAKNQGKTIAVGEIPVGDVSVTPQKEGTARVVEVSLTPYLKKWVEEGLEKVSLRIDGLGEDVTAIFAGRGHEDPAFRPCLKVVTGNAQDPDSMDITKVWQKNKIITGQSGRENPGEVVLGNGGELYLQYGIHPENIQGAIYHAALQLKQLAAEENARLKVYQVPGMDWDSLQQRRKMMILDAAELIYTGEILESGVDLSYAFYEAIQNGKTELNILVQATDGCIVLEDNPELKVRVSDNRDIETVMEAICHTLGDNASATEITKNLPKKYSAKTGETAEIKWRAIDRVTGLSAKEAIAANGEVRKPRWFEESRRVWATATVTAGDYSRQRTYAFTVAPTTMPDYAGVTFGNMVAIGDVDNEKERYFESTGTSMESRFVGGRNIPYRRLSEQSVLALSLAVDGEKQNYLTLKIWGGDAFSGVQISSLQDRDLGTIFVTRPDVAVEEDGFLYLTCPLPEGYTRGRDYCSLQLTKVETESPEELAIYGAYITQSPCFEPESFAEQGEVLVKNLSFADTGLYQLLHRLTARFEQDAEELQEDETKENLRTVLAESEESKIVVDFSPDGKTASIYRKTPYYSAYGETKVLDYKNGGMKAVSYGGYKVFQNRSEEEQTIPWQEEKLSGLYRDLLGGDYYAFLGKNQTADTSGLPEGTLAEKGENLTLKPGETAVLMLVAEPLACPDWRIAEINGQPAASVAVAEPLEITTITVKNLGERMEQEQTFTLVCGVYERGLLAGMQKAEVQVLPFEDFVKVFLPEGLQLLPGQTLRIFLEEEDFSLKAMTPVLEIP